jgi:hypothetical protein
MAAYQWRSKWRVASEIIMWRNLAACENNNGGMAKMWRNNGVNWRHGVSKAAWQQRENGKALESERKSKSKAKAENINIKISMAAKIISVMKSVMKWRRIMAAKENRRRHQRKAAKAEMARKYQWRQ